MGTNSSSSLNGTVNHGTGIVTLGSGAGGNMLLVNGGGVYQLNGGTLKSGNASSNRGIILGVNTNNGSAAFPNTFRLQDGALDLATNAAILQIGRSETTAATNTHNLFDQTGGTAGVGTLTIGGRSTHSSVNSTLRVTGGSFTANSFTFMALSLIHI